MDPVKISGIKDWPTPRTVKDVRSFLGFCNFYRPFIRGFATVAKALNTLTKKDSHVDLGRRTNESLRRRSKPE
jgi:hypothetical protein